MIKLIHTLKLMWMEYGGRASTLIKMSGFEVVYRMMQNVCGQLTDVYLNGTVDKVGRNMYTEVLIP